MPSLSRGGEPLDRAGYQAVGRLVRLAFAQRRKQLGTSLAATAGPDPRALARADVARALEAAGASVTARPEELAPAQWLTFARALGRLAAP